MTSSLVFLKTTDTALNFSMIFQRRWEEIQSLTKGKVKVHNLASDEHYYCSFTKDK